MTGTPEQAGPAPVLFDIAERGADSRAREWLANTLCAVRAGASADVFHGAFAGAARRLASAKFNPIPEEIEALSAFGLGISSWTAARAARTGLLCELDGSHPNPVPVVARVYRTGDSSERVAVLGALAVLSRPDRYVDVALEACRTHVTHVFEAIACENPYPSRHFTERAFNEMVLKSLFLGVKPARIAGLRDRYNAELVQMLRTYVQERSAAGRSIPSDANWLLHLEAGEA